MDKPTKTTPATSTITKKELIERIAGLTGEKRVVVKRIVQSFLDEVVVDLRQGNRLEFRDFGVFEVKQRKGRTAQNPKTLERVEVPPKRTVRFKAGRLMREATEAPGAPAGQQSIEAKPAPKAARPTREAAAFAEAKPAAKRPAGATRH